MSETQNSDDGTRKWLHPNEVLKLQRLKIKKKQLQARFNKNLSYPHNSFEHRSEPVPAAIKRRNPFVNIPENKRAKVSNNDVDFEESSDQTLFKLLHLSDVSNSTRINQPRSFNNVLVKIQKAVEPECTILGRGKAWVPVDWALKSKLRLMSSKPFAWNQKLKISEEASGITGFVRCLDNNSETKLDTSPNARFHQCCYYWQHPSLPWLNLFPRVVSRSSTMLSVASTTSVRDTLHREWTNSLRSLFQLVRTRQCPYFYLCANTFTVLFRAAGISGHSEMNAVVSPTTRGFRQLLMQEEIEFTMPLKQRRTSDPGYETLDSTTAAEANVEEEESPDEWLQSMGVNAEDIKQINYNQARISHKVECEVDNSEQSLIVIEDMEVHGLYNFLMNCKSATSTTGPLAGIPPTLLAPIGFHGATISALKVKESKVRLDESQYFSLEITGPILPQLIHNLCALHPPDQDLTATFACFHPTLPFSKVKVLDQSEKENNCAPGSTVFGQENLSDCGLNPTVLKHFCSPDFNRVCNVECLKYDSETRTYTWS